MPGLADLSRNRKLLLAAGVTVVIGALVVALAVLRPWSSDQKDAADVAPPVAGDKVLQSVSVDMQPDGSLSTIGDTVVISRASSGDTDTYTTSHDPSEVVDDLPVRVVPSYRTETASGNNLADLKGYTGLVTIDLTVQNLTVQQQQVTYDAGGQSHTTTALVGAPLTVVASASLPGVDPASVVTATTDGATTKDTTNGVLSRSANQQTQVQWATILAPPQLSATATLQLVINAKDFVVPTVDVNVQPGLVTDPSVGALVDAAFDPKNSDELALVSRTIGVVGDVNDVLSRASSQISKVRRTLDTDLKTTLGNKTVVSLQADTKQIDSSLKQADKNLDSLNDALRSSLKSTSSSTLASLASTVSEIDALLGDTSEAPPTVTVSGSGCDSQVSAPKSGGTVYGNLLQVTAQLNAYAGTTRECKVELQKTITDTIGPADTSNCSDSSTSVTCSLDALEQNLSGIGDDIKAAQQVSADLDPEQQFAESRADVTALIKRLDDLVDDIGKLTDDSDDADQPAMVRITNQLKAASTSLSAADDSLAAIGTAVDNLHKGALDNVDDVESMVEQNQDLADALCQVSGDGTEPGKLAAAQVEELRSYLVTESCPDANGDTTELTPPAKYGAAMSTRLQAQADAWTDVAATTDTGNTDSGLGKLLNEATSNLDDVKAAIKQATSDAEASLEAVQTVDDSAQSALDDLNTLDKQLGALQDNYTASQKDLDKALSDAAEKASTTDISDAIDQVAAQGQASSDELGKAFENSAAGLESAADALQKSGAAAVDKQRADLAKTQKQATNELTASTKAALSQVSGDVSSAARDLDTTRSQLTRDLTNILLDLGDPKVSGSGVIGLVGKSATAAGSADYQLAMATDKATAYAAVREQDVNGIMLRQAQAEASLQRQADLPAFAMELPDGVQHRTVYTFHLAGG